MYTVEASIHIGAPIEDLFDLTQDYRRRLDWDPFLRDLRFLNGATEAAVGVQVRVRAWNGLTMTVKYVALDRPRVVAMRMLSGPFFLRAFVGSWRFAQTDDGATRVVFRYVFESRWHWLRWLLDPLIATAFRRDVRARLRGLKRGAETIGLLDR